MPARAAKGYYVVYIGGMAFRVISFHDNRQQLHWNNKVLHERAIPFTGFTITC